MSIFERLRNLWTLSAYTPIRSVYSETVDEIEKEFMAAAKQPGPGQKLVQYHYGSKGEPIKKEITHGPKRRASIIRRKKEDPIDRIVKQS